MVKVQKPTPKTFTKTGGQKEKKAKLVNAPAAHKKIEKPVKQKANRTGLEEKPARKPLILAPPKSPSPVAEPPAGKKKHLTQKKVPVAAPVVTPTTAPTAGKKNKKNKSKGPQTTSLAKPEGAASKKLKQPKAPLTPAQKKVQNKRAFKKQQLKKKGKERKPKTQQLNTFDPLPFDEDKFNAIVNVVNIKKIVVALKQQVEKEVTEKKTSIFSDYRYSLNVANFKIPNAPKRMVRLTLKHSLVGKDDDIVIIVPDLQRGAKVDYEPTIQHWEDVFREAGVEGLKIMPFNQLRTECNTFEAVRKFGNTYDYFLCDGRLMGQVAGFCGKVFQKPRTTFHAVRLDQAKNIKAEVEKSLRRTAYKQLHKGDLISIPVGNHTYTAQRLAENVQHIVGQLKTTYPGGLGNVRSLHLKIDITGTSSLPLYVSMGQPPADTPYVVGPREQRMLKLKKEANEVLTNFSMTKDGDLKKLNKTQVERKRKFREAQAELLAESDKAAPVAEEDKEAEVAVEAEEMAPKKKARKEEKAKRVEEKIPVVKKVVEKEDDEEEDEDEDEDNQEVDEDDNEEDDDDDEEDDDDDDDEENDDDEDEEDDSD